MGNRAMSGGRVIEYYHPARVALSEKVKLFPDLMDQLQEQPADEFETRIAVIAAYCDILLDGDYLPSDLDDLCKVLIKKLELKYIAPHIVTSIN